MIYKVECAQSEQCLEVEELVGYVSIRITDASANECMSILMEEEEIYNLVGALLHIQKKLKK